MTKIGLGGSCHWCTEAVFQAVEGVEKVEQGWIASVGIYTEFSEAVIVHFKEECISLNTLIKIHLHSHSCTANHPMRQKYRSAIYTFSKRQAERAAQILGVLQKDFDLPFITKVLPFHTFKENQESYLDYYKKNPEKPFCQRYIEPKLQQLKEQFGELFLEGKRTV